MATPSSSYAVFWKFVTLSVVAVSVALSGCGGGIVTSLPGTSTNQIQGTVQGGLQPIAGATIQLFAASSKGRGTAATSLLSAQVATNSTGSFSLPAQFQCLNATDQMYIVATGGNPGTGANRSLALMADLGTCSKLTSSSTVYINEVTTIASVYALAPFMNTGSFDVASNSTEVAAVAAAYSAASTLANLGTGVALASSPVQSKLNSLSDSLAACINSSSTATACTNFFADATPPGSTAVPANTIAAILDIALNPTNDVVKIYNVASATPFQPFLAASPADWTLFGSPTSATLTTPVISWSTPVGITYGTALSAAQLNATSSVAGSFAYTPSLGALLSAGATTLTATFTPTDTTTYTSASATVNLAVSKATPAISWSSPSTITSGTPLSAAQLDATSAIAGTFAYSPAAGTIPAVGTTTLTTTFTPSDTANYNSATGTVGLTVNQGSKTAPTISWGTPASITYGTALSAAQLNATSSIPGTFTYSPAAGVVPTAGIATLTANFTPNDTTTYAGATATVNLAVNKATPAISWSSPAAITSGTALSAAQLNATSTVAGTFIYTPAAGTIPAVGTDTLSVAFTPADAVDYASASSTVGLTVNQGNKTTPVIYWGTPAGISYGTALSAAQLNATTTTAGSFTYSPALGTVPTAGSHSLTATFTPSDTTVFAGATATVTLAVSKVTPTITWPSPAAVTSGTALSPTQLNATSSVAGTFTYIPAAGTIPAVGSDTLSVSFTPADTVDYSNATGAVALTVNQGAKTTPVINWGNPAGIIYGTALSAAQLNATSTVAGSFTYSPTSGTVPTAGTAMLTAIFTPNDTTTYAGATATVALAVSKATPTIGWSSPAAITSGTPLSSAQLNATSAVAGSFTYSPSAGTVLAVGTDALNVTFTPSDTVNYNSATGTVNLTVNQGAKTTPVINWGTPAGITYGTALSTAQLNATSTVVGTFTYSPAVGSIPTAGTATLMTTFTPTDTTTYSGATATVSLAVAKATPTINWSSPAAITSGTALSATQLNATSSVAGFFTYSPATGTIPAVGPDTLSVSFTPADTTDYASATKTVSLTVSQGSKTTPTINWSTPAGITYGTTLSAAQLNATSTVAGSFAYSPAVGALPTAGTVTLTATFTPTDTTTYAGATATVSLVVGKATPTISWGTPAAISSGTALSVAQLDATSSVAGSFVYSPAVGTVPAVGTDTLSVSFTPTDSTDYSSATKTVNLTVSQGAKTTPVISWGVPAGITYGTSLSAAQLNATTTVAGIFTYSPAAGTLPTAGTATLTATFIPTDTTTYTNATATVNLAVSKAKPAISWSSPASIASGTTLSTTQLNASSTVAGFFTYSPAAGTVPPAGSDTLTATFTPTDATDYTTANMSVNLVVTGGTPPSTTNLNIGTTVSQTGLKRLGMNIDTQDFYDSGQMLRNFTFRNPGFEAETWQSILQCVTVTATSCTDQNQYAVWPANFLQGATFEFIYGSALGQTGSITSSTAAVWNTNTGTTINFAPLGKAPAVGDFVIVKMNVPNNAQAGWWTGLSGGATLSTELSDLSPNTPGKQALRVTAAGSGQSATVDSYFDGSSGRNFVLLNGTYQVAFRAKGVGGTNQMTVSVGRLESGGNENFFNQTVTLTSSWQDYTFNFSAAETPAVGVGGVDLHFGIAGANVLLDDVSLTPAVATGANPTPFRDEVVSALVALHPGSLRYMDGGTDFGSSIDNMIAPPFARLRTGSSSTSTESDDIPIGLHEFLQLCQTVGAEPWYNLPPGISTTDMQNLIQYFAGDASTPYGAKRAALGQAAPWTSVFPVIHMELGNEQWNYPTFPGNAINNATAYGSRITTIYGAARSSPSYNAASFDLIMGSFVDNAWYTGQETAAASNYDSISVAPYLFNSFNDTSSTEAIFGPMFAQPESFDSVSSGVMSQQAQAAATAGKKLVVYEENLSTFGGTASQSFVNSTVPSVAGGVTMADHMLLIMRDLGVKTQNVWALPGISNQFNNTNGGSETTPIFGTVIDMGGQTNLRRPVFLAEQLVNTAILPNMLAVSVSGANPTWNQPLSTNDSIQLNGAHELQSFAFTDGANNRSVVVVNLSRTSALPVTFSGANAPTGNVGVGVLTSANITDSNEASDLVNITNTTITNFQPTTPYSLPPFSVTVFSWQQ